MWTVYRELADDQGETAGKRGIAFHGRPVYWEARLRTEPLLDILYEDADLLALNKPAGLVCHPTKGDQYSSLISRLRLYVGETVSCHIVNRLDRETSGVTLAAKNSQTAGILGKLWEKRAVQKEYLAIVHGAVTQDEGVIELPLGKDERTEIAVKDCVRPDGTPARTDYWVERRFERPEGVFSLLRIQPRTGRKHQIRIHLAALGHPIVGDKLYGSDEDMYLALAQDRLTPAHRQALLLPNQALHAASLQLCWRGVETRFEALPNPVFKAFLAGDNCHQYW